MRSDCRSDAFDACAGEATGAAWADVGVRGRLAHVSNADLDTSVYTDNAWIGLKKFAFSRSFVQLSSERLWMGVGRNVGLFRRTWRGTTATRGASTTRTWASHPLPDTTTAAKSVTVCAAEMTGSWNQKSAGPRSVSTASSSPVGPCIRWLAM